MHRRFTCIYTSRKVGSSMIAKEYILNKQKPDHYVRIADFSSYWNMFLDAYYNGVVINNHLVNVGPTTVQLHTLFIAIIRAGISVNNRYVGIRILYKEILGIVHDINNGIDPMLIVNYEFKRVCLFIVRYLFRALHTFENILYQESKKYKGANEPYVFSQQYDLCSIKFSERGVGIRIGLY